VLPGIRRSRPNATFVVAGRAGNTPIESLHDGHSCLLTGEVADLTPYFAEAAVVVVPMRGGGGTRLKLLEALGRGKAVVATSVGAEGLDVRPEMDLLIADDSGTFAEACVRLMNDREMRRRLGSSGRRRILERYQWSAIAARVEQAVGRASGHANHAPAAER
jgi:glycosyltransferase involved in cell wall biosynthesis